MKDKKDKKKSAKLSKTKKRNSNEPLVPREMVEQEKTKEKAAPTAATEEDFDMFDFLDDTNDRQKEAPPTGEISVTPVAPVRSATPNLNDASKVLDWGSLFDNVETGPLGVPASGACLVDPVEKVVAWNAKSDDKNATQVPLLVAQNTKFPEIVFFFCFWLDT